MGAVATRLSDVEGRPSSSTALPPTSFPYGMPGYGGIPPTSSVVVHTTAPQQPVPITQIAFPPSPSPIPGPYGSSPQLAAMEEEPADQIGVPRYHKLSFPTFDGRDDPMGWLNRCEHFFRAQRTRDVDKVWLASFHLTGVAQHWYYMLERDTDEGTQISWPLFKTLCQQRFGPPLCTNHLADLARLSFQGSVAAFQEAFLAKMARVDRLSAAQQVQLFTGGLPEPLRTDVELQYPADLQRAMSLVRAYERHVVTVSANFQSRASRSVGRATSTTTPGVPAPAQPQDTTTTVPPPPTPIEALSSLVTGRNG